MFKFFSLFLCLMGSILPAHATVQIIVLLSASNQENTHKRYFHECARVLAAAQSLDWPIQILAQDGQHWKIKGIDESERAFAPFADQIAFLSSEDAQRSIRRTDPKTQSMLIVIVGHGGISKNTAHLQDIQFYPWSPQAPQSQKPFSVSKLKEIIRQVASAQRPVRIVCLSCFAGGIHQIAREMDHVCTVSTTPFFMTAISERERNPFNDKFWETLSNGIRGIRTFSQAALMGFAEDDWNLNLGSLSSTDYMDFILQKGPYHPRIHELMLDGEIKRLYRGNQDRVPPHLTLEACNGLNIGQPPLQTMHWPDLAIVDPAKMLPSPSQTFLEFLQQVNHCSGGIYAQCCCRKPQQVLQKKIEELKAMIHSLRDYEYPVEDGSGTLKIPEDFLNLLLSNVTLFFEDFSAKIESHQFNDTLLEQVKMWKESKEKLLEEWMQFKKLEKEYFELTAIHQELSKIHNAVSLEEQRTDYQQRGWSLNQLEPQYLTDLESKMDSQLRKAEESYSLLKDSQSSLNAGDWVSRASHTLQRLDSFKEFFLVEGSQVTDINRKKLLRLLLCEWEHLSPGITRSPTT